MPAFRRPTRPAAAFGLLLLPTALGVGLLAPAAGADDPAFTLERVMADPEWIGLPPTDPYWSIDGRTIYFNRQRAGSELVDLWRIPLPSGEASRVPDAELTRVDASEGRWNAARSKRVAVRFGDVFLRDARTGVARQLTRSVADESDPIFLAGEAEVAYFRGDGVFAFDLAQGLERQLADLRLAKDPDAEKPPSGYLAEQQKRLFDVVREVEAREAEARDDARTKQLADPGRPPLAIFLGDDVAIGGRALSPGGRYLALVVAGKDRDRGRRDAMPVWINEDGYAATREVRPKVGTGDGSGERLWIVDLATRERHEVDLSLLPGIADDPLAALKAAAKERAAKASTASAEAGTATGDAAEGGEEAARNEAGGDDDEDGEKGEKPARRAVETEDAMRWSPDGARLAVMLHSLDNKDRWLVLVEPSTSTDAAGKATVSASLATVERLSDPEGWINWSFNDFDFLAGGALWFLSEASGWSQLYLHDPSKATTRRLTGGDHVVAEPEPTADGKWIYYDVNAEHPGVYESWRVEVASGRNEAVSALGGINDGHLSPDGRSLLLVHSTTTGPPELYLQAAKPGAEARRLTRTVSEAFAALPWTAPELVDVPSSHQPRPVPSRFYPAGANGDGRAVVFVHGAGYLQNAHAGWSSYFREFMFHSFLAERGYAVLDMDYRGSAGYGRAWRTAIYRHMGQPELEDLADGVAWLVREHGVDPGRVAVYGGSYGGFLTLMALFKQPDLFASGAALRPVTDWAHYNHPYTSNILNTPDVDPEAYERSSPIEFASGLAKPLLICAPMVDDNVLFLDVVRLNQRLIELEKEDWDVALFPVEPHSFRRPSSWLNEYRRIFALFERTLGP